MCCSVHMSCPLTCCDTAAASAVTACSTANRTTDLSTHRLSPAESGTPALPPVIASAPAPISKGTATKDTTNNGEPGSMATPRGRARRPPPSQWRWIPANASAQQKAGHRRSPGWVSIASGPTLGPAVRIFWIAWALDTNHAEALPRRRLHHHPPLQPLGDRRS